MISYESELTALQAAGAIDDATAARLIAVERRDVFSIYAELRTLTWLGVVAIVTALGMVLAKHIDRIGPITIASVIGLAAALCYAYAWWKRAREASLADDYILLLGSLLLSADVGYLEHTFHILGSAWSRHLLLLAVIHGFVAYAFQSRLVLSVSVSALVAYLGIDRSADALFRQQDTTMIAVRSFVAAVILLVWREVDRRSRRTTTFDEPLEHFTANLAFWGALILTFQSHTRFIGAAIAVALCIVSVRYGLRSRSEPFVLYAYVYGVIAVDALVVDLLHEEVLQALYLVVSTIAAIAGLFITHARLRRSLS